ncbi:carbamoyltransferase HypF [Metallibacterium sp.]
MSVAEAPADCIVQHRVRVRGVVQGVGFRPWVWRLAQAHALRGWVRNDSDGVDMLLQGAPADMDAFARALSSEPPPLAHIDDVCWTDAAPEPLRAEFIILESAQRNAAHTAIGADSAVCTDCLVEMFDPADRRWRYAFSNCTHCGPRYTITRGIPYDRARTSMAAFPMCPACMAEYADPADRRFHAEPIACPTCGPRLSWLDSHGRLQDCTDALQAVVAALRAGAIVAIKGLGGFHLACDARNADAVLRLRQRKQREVKPFALMLANLHSIELLALLDADERALLQSPARPIVLLRKRGGGDALLLGVCDGMARLGVMLPYTPLHYLLFHEYAGRPAGSTWLDTFDSPALVMTSANPCGEPLVANNAEAVWRLGSIADALLVHDRDIVVRCDDSVLQHAGGQMQFIRRARGYVPRAIRLHADGPVVLAVGAHLKNTLCITRGDEAFVSQHIGTLDNAATRDMFDEVTQHLLGLLQVQPEALAHDLHPDFHSTRYAQALAARLDVPCIAVQHHHAHIAAVAAEHRHAGPLLGLALDGVGLGPDGGAWGGELLRIDGAYCERLDHLRALALPGGDRAAREPWRMAAAALAAMGHGDDIARRFADQPQALAVQRWLTSGAAIPVTSSLGRWFDAAAGLLGICAVMDFEAQAAMRLEALALRHGPAQPWDEGYRFTGAGLDLLPSLQHLRSATDVTETAARFHATLATALVAWALRAARQHDLGVIALAGGCLLNTVLAGALRAQLMAHGLHVLEAQQVPPNDGGLSLGQAWVAQQHLISIN